MADNRPPPNDDNEDSRVLRKKQEIAQIFLEYFYKHGMVNTIVSDVAKEMHMSKKTIYKYFSGGKEECLYFIFYQIATESRHSYQKALVPSTKPVWEKLSGLFTHIFEAL